MPWYNFTWSRPRWEWSCPSGPEWGHCPGPDGGPGSSLIQLLDFRLLPAPLRRVWSAPWVWGSWGSVSASDMTWPASCPPPGRCSPLCRCLSPCRGSCPCRPSNNNQSQERRGRTGTWWGRNVKISLKEAARCTAMKIRCKTGQPSLKLSCNESCLSLPQILL